MPDKPGSVALTPSRPMALSETGADIIRQPGERANSRVGVRCDASGTISDGRRAR